MTYLTDLRRDTDELVAQERAALVTACLCARKQLSMSEVRAMTGLSDSGVWYLMTKITRVITCYYDRPAQTWRLSG